MTPPVTLDLAFALVALYPFLGTLELVLFLAVVLVLAILFVFYKVVGDEINIFLVSFAAD